MAKPDVQDPRATLEGILAARPDLAQVASIVFDYAQYLLDDDERLTKGGALDGAGRELLCARTLELLGGPAEETEAEAEDA